MNEGLVTEVTGSLDGNQSQWLGGLIQGLVTTAFTAHYF
jgi:hypothetical protein